jgi:sugar fermentation stimulation protein A
VRLIPPLAPGVLVRRYKRFLADVELPSGVVETMHCPNTGAMTGCDLPGSECWYSRSDNPRRKYSGTLEVVVTNAGRIGINTLRANGLVKEALLEQRLRGFEDAVWVRSEVAIPDEAGRFDLLLKHQAKDCFIEVKNVTLSTQAGFGRFPDAKSERALKHVRALQRQIDAGAEAALIFCVAHTGIKQVTTAEDIHPEYAHAVKAAQVAGVRVLAFACSIEADEIRLAEPLPVVL